MIRRNESEIWNRVVEKDESGFDDLIAKRVLNWDFWPEQHERVNELSTKAATDSLTEEEEQELAAYVHVGDLLAILHSKARMTLANGDDS